MLTLDSGSVSLSRSARGDSVQTIWLAGRHSDPFTLDTTVLRCVKVAPLGMFFLAYLLDTYILIFEGCASWSHDLSLLAFVSWLAWHSIGCVDSGISATFSFQKVIVYIGVESALLVLDCTQSLACVTCCIQKGQDVRMNNFFCVNTFLRCSTVSSPMLTINSAVLFACDTFFICQIARRVLRYWFQRCRCLWCFTQVRRWLFVTKFCSCCWRLDVCIK